MKTAKSESYRVKKIAGIGIFAALAIVVSFATSYIKILHLSLDAGDVVIVLASFIWGPVSGVAISAVSAAVGLVYSGTGPWGMLMDFCSSATFAFVASFVYMRRKSFKFAIIGLCSAVVLVCAVMMPLNILITPLYAPVSAESVIEQIPVLLLPFNFAKGLFNGGVVLLIYKPLIKTMRRAGLVPTEERDVRIDTDKKQAGGISRNSLIALIAGGVTVIVAVIILVILAN